MAPRSVVHCGAMATPDGPPGAIDPDSLLTADGIAELAGGMVKPNTVRSWWRNGSLPYEVFPELGAKSNKRTRRRDAERFLRRKLGGLPAAPLAETSMATPTESDEPHANSSPTPPSASSADLLDTLASLKAAADSAMQALIAEAEHHAEMAAAQAAVSRAQAEADTIRAQADAKRVETLKHLQNVFRGYDLALATHLQPAYPPLFDSTAEQPHTPQR